MTRSTTELQQPIEARPIVADGSNVKRGLKPVLPNGKAFRMKDGKHNQGSDGAGSRTLTKEERLAAKLRENLRRRKSQSREMRESDAVDLPKGDSSG